MKTFKFTYEDIEYIGDSGSWPDRTTIKAKHEFDDTITWVPVLYQFAKFLESTGYVDVVQKIQVEDRFGFHADCGFKTFGEQEEEFDDTEEEQS